MGRSVLEKEKKLIPDGEEFLFAAITQEIYHVVH